MATRLLFATSFVVLLVSTTSGLSIKPVRRSIKKTNHSNLFNTQTTPPPHQILNTEGIPGADTPLQSAVTHVLPQGNNNDYLNLYTRYLDWIERKPLVAKSVTAAVVGCLGDLMGQWIEAYMGNYNFVVNWARCRAFFLSGLVFVGPYLHNWYETLWALGSQLERRNVTKNLQTLAQVFVDQTVGVFLFLPTYFYAYELCEALVSFRVPVWSVATKKLTANLGPVLLTQYKVWPLVNFVSFSYVPKNMRVLFNNIISVFWNAFLCARLA